MKIVYIFEPLDYEEEKQSVLAIGFFDGVHLGHRALLKEAKREALRRGVEFAVMTFTPHPDEVVFGTTDKWYLTPLSEKAQRLRELGVEKLYVVHFNESFATLSPTRFIEQYIQQLRAVHVVVGYDFTFGYRAKGTVQTLQNERTTYGYDVTIVPKQQYAEEKISSTRIRKLIRNGDVERAAQLLGHPHRTTVGIHLLFGNLYEVVVNESVPLPAYGTYTVFMKQGSKRGYGELIRKAESDVYFIRSAKHWLHGKVTIEWVGAATREKFQVVKQL